MCKTVYTRLQFNTSLDTSNLGIDAGLRGVIKLLHIRNTGKQERQMEGEKLYTTQEVAKELGISGALVRRLVSQGRATPAARYGNTMVFTREEIEKLRARPKRAGRPKEQ